MPPFFKAWTHHAERSAYSWHTPGHAGGVGYLKSPVGYSLHVYVMLTDADAVYADWGKLTQWAIRRATPEAQSAMSFAAGSMSPKVEAACRFVRMTGGHRRIVATEPDPGRRIRHDR